MNRFQRPPPAVQVVTAKTRANTDEERIAELELRIKTLEDVDRIQHKRFDLLEKDLTQALRAIREINDQPKGKIWQR